MTKDVRGPERLSEHGWHTNVTMVPTDEIDMSEETPTDALDLFKYGCRLTPWHAFVNICGDNKRMSAEEKRRVNEANKIRLELVPRLEEARGFTIVISDPDLLLESQFDTTFSSKRVFEGTCSDIIPHICRLHSCSNHPRYGWSITRRVVNEDEGEH